MSGRCARTVWQGMLGGIVSLLFVNADCMAMQSAEAAALLERADSIKTSSHAEFTEILRSLEQGIQDLSPSQQEYLRYLRGWQDAYVGNYEGALTQLKSFVATSQDPTLRFRARATIVNVFSLAKRYDEAFSELNQLLERLDEVQDKGAREQGLTVAALLYDEVGQYDLSLNYIDTLIQENWNGRGMCRGGQLKVRVLFERTQGRARPAELQQEIQKGIDACVAAGELTYANVIRGYQARMHMEHGEHAQAMELLLRHYDEVRSAQYPRLTSQYDVLIAQSHWRLGATAAARQHALRAVEGSVKNEFTEPLVSAYHLLYSIDKARGAEASALDFHEKYTAADKGYLDDISTRQLAYERVRHEVAANKLQIESLTLQRALDAKAIENVRLYVALLIVILAFIGFWAYKTKRSQLHFMHLSRRDGLTGIFNRPHFMELAASTLENCQELRQDVSLVLCDLDHFKEINDRYGHAEGDEALKEVARRAEAEIRAADIFARVGGEEFCILLPGCSIEDARERAEQLRLAIGNATDKSRAKISASMGVCATKPSGYELHQLMAHADTALYQAKRAGRDCVVVYDPNSIVTQLRPGSSTAAP